MSRRELPREGEGAPVFVVIYEDGDLYPNAAVFSDADDAAAFMSRNNGFQILPTAIDRRVADAEQPAGGGRG